MKNIESALPPEWRLLFQILTLPIAWIPSVQGAIQGFLWDFSSPLGGTVRLTLFLLPAFHLIVGMWCTMLAVYTLPFRGGRHEFIVAIVTTWWDSGRAIALFWGGLFRALFLSVGWAWGLIRILAAGLYLAFVELVPLRAVRDTAPPGHYLCNGRQRARRRGAAFPGGRLVLDERDDQPGEGGYRLVPHHWDTVPGSLYPSATSDSRRHDQLLHAPHRPAAPLPAAAQVAGCLDGNRRIAQARAGRGARVQRRQGAMMGQDATMMRHARLLLVALALMAPACGPTEAETPRLSLFVGVDVSGSFSGTPQFRDSLRFLSYYLYGHLHGTGGLEKPRALFVGSIGGDTPNEPKAFYPIQVFERMNASEMESKLTELFTVKGNYQTDFNAFFKRVSETVQKQNLILAPILIVIVSDGVPEVAADQGRKVVQQAYEKIDVSF